MTARQSVTLELDNETIRCLGMLGEPIDVLARLARSAADRVGSPGPGRPYREQTDESLRVERNKADDRDADRLEAVAKAADEIVRIARHRADEVVQTAREDADRGRPPPSANTDPSSEHARARADVLLQGERSDADAVLERERVQRRRSLALRLATERESTDTDLTGERSHADALVVDQREANAQMVSTAIRAHELADEADAAKARAETSERELRTVAEFREMFIGILGHDLRNPLTGIVMSAGSMRDRGRLDDQDAESVARIIRSSKRITGMITQLLDLTRARLGGGLPIEPKPTDLRDVCRSVVEEFEAHVQVEVAGEVTGTWDDDRLAEALSNLVGNAIEHAAPGTGVSVKAYVDGADVVIEVSNRGAPIPADVLPFIFEPFRRGRQGEKSKAGNLGLGLYIAQQIVLSHGGTLDASSRDGMTTFAMRLPRRPPARPAP